MNLRKFIENYFPDSDFTNYQDIDLSEQLKIPINNDFNQILSWPPNVFIILYSLLEYTDKYRLIVSPQDHFEWTTLDNDISKRLSADWLTLITHQLTPPKEKRQLFLPTLLFSLNNVFNKDNLDKCIYDLLNVSTFIKSVFHLTLSIDELFSDVNICDYKIESKLNLALMIREMVGISHNNLADNHSKHGFVTLKINVPQSGLTINNLTHNITCIKPAVLPKIVTNKLVKKSYNKKAYNILFLPWPMKVDSSSFVQTNKANNIEMNDYFGFFDYKPKEDSRPQDFISAIISAIRRVGTIDLIVLPECSLSEKNYDRFKDILFECFGENAPSLLAGVYGDDENNKNGKNSAKLSFIGEAKNFDHVEQKKHHRWFLDNNQLRNYNLSAALDPGRKWWENISVGRRHLLTLHTTDGVKLCPLICEDLARQEPVAQAVRAVGPNLVVSLLLDGPQLPQRWPGKYAAVLSDDPGSSVLSVTALGMTLRSTGLGNPPSRGVALWSEPNNGAETLYLDEDGLGLVIGLEMQEEEMWTIDGRVKNKPVLRKKFHSTIFSEYSDTKMPSKVPLLKKELIAELKRGL